MVGGITLAQKDEVTGEVTGGNSAEPFHVRPGVSLAALSDLGCQRENNEDSWGYWEPQRDADFARKGRLAVVADGMGGYQGGEEASRLAVEVVERTYAAADGADRQTPLAEGIIKAHEHIREKQRIEVRLHGMGTTCTALALLGDAARGYQLHFAHVGDSRLYLIRGSEISRLTRDDSYVSRLVENGLIDAEEAETHPQRNILTAALGAGADLIPQVPLVPIGIQSRDALLLCSDGLWGPVSEVEMQVAVSGQSPQFATQKLVALARERGGPDNITVLILAIN